MHKHNLIDFLDFYSICRNEAGSLSTIVRRFSGCHSVYATSLPGDRDVVDKSFLQEDALGLSSLWVVVALSTFLANPRCSA